jgi:hypothetical protein
MAEQLEKLQVDVEALRRQGTPEKKEQEGSILVTEEKSRSFPQKERGKEIMPEGSWIRGRLKGWEDRLLKECFKTKG